MGGGGGGGLRARFRADDRGRDETHRIHFAIGWTRSARRFMSSLVSPATHWSSPSGDAPASGHPPRPAGSSCRPHALSFLPLLSLLQIPGGGTSSPSPLDRRHHRRPDPCRSEGFSPDGAGAGWTVAELSPVGWQREAPGKTATCQPLSALSCIQGGEVGLTRSPQLRA